MMTLSDLAVVAIGRNEGVRIAACIASVDPTVQRIVYVDSGSTDNSLELVAKTRARTVALDLSIPFTAARARNTGFKVLDAEGNRIAYVQFVDGDCELCPGWLARARDYLDRNPKVVAVFGRRKERYPGRSIYNTMCDLEWQVPPGEVAHFGGDVMIRVAALASAGGYRDDLIAGEEPELSVRLRAKGWRIVCLDAPMTIHDAAMTHFRQWWRRAERCGYAYANGAYLHGGPPERHWVKQSVRSWIWAAGIPLFSIGCALIFGPAGLLPLVLFPIQVLRLYYKRRAEWIAPLKTSFFMVLQKFPEVAGQVKFVFDLIAGRRGHIIEYK